MAWDGHQGGESMVTLLIGLWLRWPWAGHWQIAESLRLRPLGLSLKGSGGDALMPRLRIVLAVSVPLTNAAAVQVANCCPSPLLLFTLEPREPENTVRWWSGHRVSWFLCGGHSSTLQVLLIAASDMMEGSEMWGGEVECPRKSGNLK